MTQPPAGWYPEPDPAYAGQPGRLRYWDGQGWTEHVHEPPVAQPPVAQPPVEQPPVQQPPAYPPTYPTYAQSQQPYGQQPQYQQYPAGQQYPTQPGAPYGAQPYYQEPASPRTPDGVPLAGWWWRVLARVLDGLISLPLTALATVPVIAWQWDSLSQWVDDLEYASNHNTADPPAPDILTPFSGPWVALVVASFVAYLIYEVVFLLWKQATPGKLILGMKVRLRERPELPAGAVLARAFFPILGQFCFIVSLLDYLWPLWDGKKQALHDKVARTNVIKPT